MDECGSAVTNVDGVGACPTATSTPTAPTSVWAKSRSSPNSGQRQFSRSSESYGTTPPNALANRLVHTLIVLRVTRTNQAPLVTWVDQLLDCPDIAVPSNGNAIQKTRLHRLRTPGDARERTRRTKK
jgi:hypothetical protein